MKNKKKTTVNKKRSNKSMKGKWGRVGAPPKRVNWPERPFTMKQLFARNTTQCELSVRSKVNDGLADGTILELKPVNQPGGKVGRPQARFVLKEHYDSSKMELANRAPARRKSVVMVETMAVQPIIPAVEPTPTVGETIQTADMTETAEVPFNPPTPEGVGMVFAPLIPDITIPVHTTETDMTNTREDILVEMREATEVPFNPTPIVMTLERETAPVPHEAPTGFAAFIAAENPVVQ